MWQKSKNIYHLFQAQLATVRYANPARGMTVIGVTGTDGKTTTSSLIYHLLNKAGYKTALISTVSAVIDGTTYDTGFHVSTPDAWHLQAYIKKAKAAGVTHLVLEVTSHALDQNRVAGIPFEVGVITNITREHLDYHKTMENYRRAKAKLLIASKTAVLNKDDSSFTFLKSLLGNKPIITYGLGDDAQVNPQTYLFTTTLFGMFNTYNILAAFSAGSALRLEKKTMVQALKSFVLPPGRCEVVYDKDFKVIIDFAHTPNGIAKLLEAVKKEQKKGKIIHVFGSAGERDRGKRKEMGESSSRFADSIILTAEDPRGEDVSAIIEQIRQGITAKDVNVQEIPDRQAAITQAIKEATKGDIVVITGKGHEQSMNFHGQETPWSEHEAVEKAFEVRGKR
jgi:UDP-N-acetylmuramoyl-L-alanyl-D-glutamate--2,6-diaminopimelate ligase